MARYQWQILRQPFVRATLDAAYARTLVTRLLQHALGCLPQSIGKVMAVQPDCMNVQAFELQASISGQAGWGMGRHGMGSDA